MANFLSIMIPAILFMLTPVLIPVVGVVVGAIADRLRPEATTPAQAAVNRAKARSAALHGAEAPEAPSSYAVRRPVRGRHATAA